MVFTRRNSKSSQPLTKSWAIQLSVRDMMLYAKVSLIPNRCGEVSALASPSNHNNRNSNKRIIAISSSNSKVSILKRRRRTSKNFSKRLESSSKNKQRKWIKKWVSNSEVGEHSSQDSRVSEVRDLESPKINLGLCTECSSYLGV